MYNKQKVTLHQVNPEQSSFDQDKWFSLKQAQAKGLPWQDDQALAETESDCSSQACSDLYDFKSSKLKNFFKGSYRQQFPFEAKPVAQAKRFPMRFTEKHLIESLSVHAACPRKPVMFYSMLNQGNKRGK